MVDQTELFISHTTRDQRDSALAHKLAAGLAVSERLRLLDQLKNDGLINDEEYSSKRKEILGEL